MHSLPNATMDSEDSGDQVLHMEHPEDMLAAWRQNPWFWEILVAHAITFVVGVLGNFLVVLVMLGDRKSRTSTNMFLISLTAADLLLLIVYAPLNTLQYFVVEWDAVGTVCKMATYAEMLSCAASIFNLTAVSLERSVLVHYSRRMTIS